MQHENHKVFFLTGMLSLRFSGCQWFSARGVPCVLLRLPLHKVYVSLGIFLSLHLGAIYIRGHLTHMSMTMPIGQPSQLGMNIF